MTSELPATLDPAVPLLREDELDGSVLDRFTLVAARCADLVAVSSPRATLTFHELDIWSDVLADALLEDIPLGDGPLGDGPVADGRLDGEPAARRDGDGSAAPIAVLLGHDVSAVVAILAVLKTGRPCVPLDAFLPPERLGQILALAGVSVCVTDPAHHDTAAGLPAVTRTVDVGELPAADAGSSGSSGNLSSSRRVWTAAVRERVERRAPRRSGTDPVALLFTSGSTGQPKGVVWHHRALLYHVWGFQESLGLQAGERTGLFLPYSFVGGFDAMTWALQSGASVQMYDLRSTGVRELAGWLRRTRLTTTVITPSLLRTILAALEPDEVLADLHQIHILGEAVYAADIAGARRHLPADAVVVNTYGASELGPTTAYPMPSDLPLADGLIPCGWPLPGKQLRLLREDGTSADVDEPGEVVVTSDYMSGGYWRNEEMTAARFSRTAAGEARYRTGDVGRIGTDGCLRVTGRRDSAVKIRGYLVEPAEIESALLASDQVAEAVVVPDRGAESVRLVAYVVPARETRLSPAAVRRLLRTTLPSYMVPATIVALPALPRTERGKIDRLALPPAPPGPRLGQDPPRNQWEEAVAALWAQVLNLEDVGIHDDFVELGGDSLIAEELLARTAELGVRLPTSTIADAPTVAEFARRVGHASADGLRHPDVVPLQTGGEGTPLFCFAGAGGLAVGMLTLARHFSGRRPVYGLQAHGLEYRGIPDWTVQAAARRHARHLRLLQPCGPYVLAGHSFGGLVAMEVARILVAAGEEVALLVLVDSFLSDSVTLGELGVAVPSQRRDSPNPRLPLPAGMSGGARTVAASYRAALGRARLLARLPFTGVVRFSGMRQYDVFYDQARLLTKLYRPRPWPGRALVWLAEGRQDGDIWSALMPGDATIRWVDGDHDNVLREPLVSQLAAEIEAALAGVVR